MLYGLTLIIIDGHYNIHKRSQKKINTHFIFSVTTLPFTSMKILKCFEYLYYDYFIVMPIHSTEVNKWRENQTVMFTYLL